MNKVGILLSKVNKTQKHLVIWADLLCSLLFVSFSMEEACISRNLKGCSSFKKCKMCSEAPLRRAPCFRNLCVQPHPFARWPRINKQQRIFCCYEGRTSLPWRMSLLMDFFLFFILRDWAASFFCTLDRLTPSPWEAREYSHCNIFSIMLPMFWALSVTPFYHFNNPERRIYRYSHLRKRHRELRSWLQVHSCERLSGAEHPGRQSDQPLSSVAAAAWSWPRAGAASVVFFLPRPVPRRW